jgi:amino acid transporter
MTTEHRPQDEGLVRAIGTPALSLSIVNLVVGGGIFVLPGVVAAELGSTAFLAYLVCSVAVGLVFLCFAEVGGRVTRSGGTYAYIEEAFGPLAGFVASIMFWLGFSVLSDAAITVAMVETLAGAFPVLERTVPRAIFIILLFGGLAFVNVRGVKTGIRLVIFNTMAKLVPLLLLLVAGLFVMNPDYLAIAEWPSAQRIGATALILFFAFMGAESGLSASGEIANPARTVPRGMLFGLLGILLLYMGLQMVSQGVLGPELAGSEAPLADAATKVFGTAGGKLLLAGGVISIYATISGDMLGAPRVIFASARAGNLPAFLAKVHPRYKTPYLAVIFFAIITCTVAISGTFRPLAVVASSSILALYASVSLAVIRLRARDGLPPPGAFRLRGGPVIPVLSCLVIGWLLWQLSAAEAIGLVALVGVALVAYGARAVARRT